MMKWNKFHSNWQSEALLLYTMYRVRMCWKSAHAGTELLIPRSIRKRFFFFIFFIKSMPDLLKKIGKKWRNASFILSYKLPKPSNISISILPDLLEFTTIHLPPFSRHENLLHLHYLIRVCSFFHTDRFSSIWSIILPILKRSLPRKAKRIKLIINCWVRWFLKVLLDRESRFFLSNSILL